MMKVEISKQVGEWLLHECFPFMKDVGSSRVNIFSNQDDVEYWINKIVQYTLEQVETKLQKKMFTGAAFFKLKLEVAEGYTLYRFLFNYPIPEREIWKTSQRQFIVSELHRQMNEPEPEAAVHLDFDGEDD